VSLNTVFNDILNDFAEFKAGVSRDITNHIEPSRIAYEQQISDLSKGIKDINESAKSFGFTFGLIGLSIGLKDTDLSDPNEIAQFFVDKFKPGENTALGTSLNNVLEFAVNNREAIKHQTVELIKSTNSLVKASSEIIEDTIQMASNNASVVVMSAFSAPSLGISLNGVNRDFMRKKEDFGMDLESTSISLSKEV